VEVNETDSVVRNKPEMKGLSRRDKTTANNTNLTPIKTDESQNGKL